MIPIENTSNTVVMLLVAGGVGLIGGVGAGLLEVRGDAKKAKEGAKTIASSIVLGGIAAIAILYFFPPEEVIGTETVNGVVKSVKEYDLTKLVALALIVGSAGASFLLVMQKRTLALTEAEKETADAEKVAVEKSGDVETIKVKASETLEGVNKHLPTLARTTIMQDAAPVIREALEKASATQATQVSPETVADLLEEVADKAEAAVQQTIEPVVQAAQKRILTAPPEVAPAR
jgi:hypothetical protein